MAVIRAEAWQIPLSQPPKRWVAELGSVISPHLRPPQLSRQLRVGTGRAGHKSQCLAAGAPRCSRLEDSASPGGSALLCP